MEATDSWRLSQRLGAHVALLIRGSALASSACSVRFARFPSLDGMGINAKTGMNSMPNHWSAADAGFAPCFHDGCSWSRAADSER